MKAEQRAEQFRRNKTRNSDWNGTAQSKQWRGLQAEQHAERWPAFVPERSTLFLRVGTPEQAEHGHGGEGRVGKGNRRDRVVTNSAKYAHEGLTPPSIAELGLSALVVET